MHPSPLPHSRLASLAPTVRARGDDTATHLRCLVRSGEPAVVFTSLSHLCVPAFSDACIIDIVEQGELSYRIAHHRSDLDRAALSGPKMADRSMRTSFASAVSDDPDADYVGVITHWWRYRHPTVADKTRAAILARDCVAIVAEERHAGLSPTHDPVEQLRVGRARKPLLRVPRLGSDGPSQRENR